MGDHKPVSVSYIVNNILLIETTVDGIYIRPVGLSLSLSWALNVYPLT